MGMNTIDNPQQLTICQLLQTVNTEVLIDALERCVTATVTDPLHITRAQPRSYFVSLSFANSFSGSMALFNGWPSGIRQQQLP